MQGRSLLPVLRGRTPRDWRTSMYYRYYHDPGHHNTRAHYGVRTRTHKLIYFWKKDQWELYDLVEGSAGAAQPVRTAGAGGADGDAEDRAGAAEARGEGRRSARRRPDSAGRRRLGGAAARQVGAAAGVMRALTPCSEVRPSSWRWRRRALAPRTPEPPAGPTTRRWRSKPTATTRRRCRCCGPRPEPRRPTPTSRTASARRSNGSAPWTPPSTPTSARCSIGPTSAGR